MSFDTEVARNGHGLLFQMEQSTDHFSSTTYFWSNIAHTFSGNVYESRIISVSRVQRGLTNDHNMAASTVEVVLDNIDGVADYLVNRANLEATGFKTRFRIYVAAYDPASPTISRKLLGTFGSLDFPKRNGSKVTLTLADDTSIDGAEFALPPSLKTWVTDAGSDHANNPLCKSASTLVDDAVFFTPYDAPLQLAFGGIGVDCQKAADYDLAFTDTNFARRALVVCATTDTGTVTAYDVEDLRLVVPGSDGTSQYLNGKAVPKSFSYGSAPGTIWTASRSQTLSRDGRNWKIIWIDLDLAKLWGWMATVTYQTFGGASWLLNYNTTHLGQGLLDGLFGIIGFKAYGWPYSSRTTPSTALPTWTSGVRAPEIAYDLIAYYSHGLSTSNADLASFQRATQVLPGFFASGVLDDLTQLSSTRFASEIGNNALVNQKFAKVEAVGGRLRKVLSDLARSGSFDIFVSWAGVFTATAQVSNVTDQTTAITELAEQFIVNGEWEDGVPSPGERWAPHNQVYITGIDGSIGPFNNEAAIAAWGRKLPFTLDTKWVSPNDYAVVAGAVDGKNTLILFNTAALESKARPRLKFTYGSLEVMALDIGSFFKMSINRGGSLAALYSSAIFKVEQIDFLPENGAVYIEAIWYDDLISDVPYLLDDETFATFVTSGGGRTVTVQDSHTQATFSSGSLITDGVDIGDILVLKDSTQNDDVFSRYRAIRINDVTSATTLELTSSDLNFGSPGGTAVVSWEIRHGKITYPTSVSDPTHYPNGSAFYGKVTNTSGKFFDTTDGNKLLDG